jgi:hypothetical protein
MDSSVDQGSSAGRTRQRDVELPAGDEFGNGLLRSHSKHSSIRAGSAPNNSSFAWDRNERRGQVDIVNAGGPSSTWLSSSNFEWDPRRDATVVDSEDCTDDSLIPKPNKYSNTISIDKEAGRIESFGTDRVEMNKGAHGMKQTVGRHENRLGRIGSQATVYWVRRVCSPL